MIRRAGFSSYAVGWALAPDVPAELRLDASGVIALAADLGYRTVQLADNVPLVDLSAKRRAALRRQADAAGIAIEVGTRGFTPGKLSRAIALAREFASPFLRVVIDTPRNEPNPPAVIQRLQEYTAALADARVVLAIENHDRFNAATLAHIISAVNSPWVGICLDTANSLGAGEDVRTVVSALKQHVVNVHLKDVRARRVPYLQGFTIEGTPLGKGQVPIDWVLDELQRHSPCQSATLEHWVPPEAHSAGTILKEREWCVRSTWTMRRLFPTAFNTPASPAP
jgi:sugar phosphate isomerase/epimerase